MRRLDQVVLSAFGGRRRYAWAVAVALLAVLIPVIWVSQHAAAASTTIWGDGTPPNVHLANDDRAVELGTEFTPTTNGTVSAIRFYKVKGESGTHTGTIWSPSGAVLATTTFASETASGWQQAALSSPLELRAGARYVVSYHVPKGGRYAATRHFSGSSRTGSIKLHGASGVFNYGATSVEPSRTTYASQYWADLVFTPTLHGSQSATAGGSASARPGHSPTPTKSPATGSSPSPVPHPSGTPSPTPSAKPSSTPKPSPTQTGTGSSSPAPSSSASGQLFPTRDSAGLPAGWAPKSSITGNLVITTPGEVVQDLRITNGTIIVKAPNVTLQRIDAVGSSVTNGSTNQCYAGLLIEDSDFTPNGVTTDSGTPVIGYGSYTVRNVMIDGVPEGLRVSGADMGCGPVYAYNSFIRVKSPDVCNDWHGDGIQGYVGSDVYVTDTTIIMQTVNGCGGTAPFFYPDQENATAHINGLLVQGGPYPFRLQRPGTVENLDVVNNNWAYGPIDVNCKLITEWSAQLVTLDSNGQPVPVRPLACT